VEAAAPIAPSPAPFALATPASPPMQASLIPAEPEPEAAPAPVAAAPVNPFLRTQPAIFEAPKAAEPKPEPAPSAPDWLLEDEAEPPQADKPN
jgi:hypothetical protein